MCCERHGERVSCLSVVCVTLSQSINQLSRFTIRLCLYSPDMAAAHLYGATFVWDGNGPLMHWPRPAAVAAIYLALCVIHNRARATSSKDPSNKHSSAPVLSAVGVAHNALLVAFSALVSVATSTHLVPIVQQHGLRHFLCPPMPATPIVSVPTLSGPMYFWCYIFYLSKYYELVDTALLMLRGKRVIALHAIHHAFIPLTMCILFDGGVSVSLVSLSIVNGFVHFVMYGYFLAVDLGFAPPLWWKRSITQLQILQVTHCAPVAKLPPHGVPGPLALLSSFLLCPSATVHDWCRRWVVLLADAHARPQAAHRPRRLAADAVAQLHAHVCRWRAHPSAACWRTSTLVLVLVLSPSLVPVADPGGEPRTVLVGYLMNILLLLLFMRFYHATYSRSRPISVKSKSR